MELEVHRLRESSLFENVGFTLNLKTHIQVFEYPSIGDRRVRIEHQKTRSSRILLYQSPAVVSGSPKQKLAINKLLINRLIIWSPTTLDVILSAL